MRRYAGLQANDIADSNCGMAVSFWTQGCPHRCKGCHNPETWDFNGGMELPDNYLAEIAEKIEANGLQRNLSILGGEPLCKENKSIVKELVEFVKNKYEDIKVTIWTGYVLEDLIVMKDPEIDYILNQVYLLIDGPFIQDQKSLLIALRGSTNQRLLYQKDIQEIIAQQK